MLTLLTDGFKESVTKTCHFENIPYVYSEVESRSLE